jgi:hypothetical protein
VYEARIRKLIRHADGSSVVQEDIRQVKHEEHAKNLAARIARDFGVQWVEIEETNGRFKARAKLGRGGVVHESFERRNAPRRRRAKTLRKSSRSATGIILLILVAVVFFLLILFLTKST